MATPRTKYHNYIQPTIVKTSSYVELPEDLKKKYFVNFNVVGVRYFLENFILIEQNGNLCLLEEDGRDFELEDSTDLEVVDVPRIYIQLTDSFINDETYFFDFFSKAVSNNFVYLTGTENFKPGEDYLINTTFYNYLYKKFEDEKSKYHIDKVAIDVDHYVIGDYIDENANVTEWFDELSDKEKQFIDYKYYKKKNDLLNNMFSEDMLNSFCSTFCKTILDGSDITSASSKIQNQIYKQVLNYYANGGTDCALVGLNLILGSTYGSITNTMSSPCSCNSAVTDTTYSTDTCANMYDSAMKLYLKQMLGDSEFYKDWFRIPMDNGTYIVNDVLCDALTTLIDEFLNLASLYNYDLSTSKGASHGCCQDSSMLSSSCKSYEAIENYKKVLELVKSDNINGNQNKIKVYGQAFGSILPILNF